MCWTWFLSQVRNLVNYRVPKIRCSGAGQM
jgi:hypothetical protein